ncbi:MAG TPA: NAD(P)/FAD-dependent oxidoreductase [Ilumatobacter sp.]|nr:NAD(P)/FAD-dependent oxidoreductase [Ilumatobacter sp.]
MSEYFDVVVVGAGISGIGAGVHLQRDCPDRTYVVLEGRSELGGTWSLFTYPGIRSDSDMHTLGYSFKPWIHERSIADGPSILAYLKETAAEFGVDRHIRYDSQVTRAEWSSDTARWTVSVTGREPIECNFLFMCSGYYSYKGGFTPEFPGIEQFGGQVVHPQEWPDDLDYSGKRVVVIGSGATAMTLVPAMVAPEAPQRASHVTMLQRSPTYVVARPAKDAIANRLRKVLPEKLAYRITRKKNVALQQFFYGASRKNPEKAKQRMLEMTAKALGQETVDQHFTPTYYPWDQRLCLIPDGDLYEAITRRDASVVTDHIDTFTPSGIRLTSGAELEADIVVTATGLQLVTIGEIDFTVDDVPVDFGQTFTYKGLGYSDVPNLVSSFGYINASWTLRSDITCGFVTRLLNHMRATGTDTATPRLRVGERDMAQRPMFTQFNPGYINRVLDKLPKQGDHAPWLNPQVLKADKAMIVKAPVDDGAMQFTKSKSLLPTAGH